MVNRRTFVMGTGQVDVDALVADSRTRVRDKIILRQCQPAEETVLRTGVNQVLAVVQHEQRLARLEISHERVS